MSKRSKLFAIFTKAANLKARLSVAIVAVSLLGFSAYFFGESAAAAVTNVLAVGTLAESEVIGGPARVTTRTLSFAPGEVGVWHYHPGPLFNVVTQGTVTLEDGFCGPDRSFGPGQAFEEGGRIHRPRNNGSEPTFAYQTFVTPLGSQTTINLPNFVPRCQVQH